jgi:hypothetical protein
MTPLMPIAITTTMGTDPFANWLLEQDRDLWLGAGASFLDSLHRPLLLLQIRRSSSCDSSSHEVFKAALYHESKDIIRNGRKRKGLAGYWAIPPFFIGSAFAFPEAYTYTTRAFAALHRSAHNTPTAACMIQTQEQRQHHKVYYSDYIFRPNKDSLSKNLKWTDLI